MIKKLFIAGEGQLCIVEGRGYNKATGRLHRLAVRPIVHLSTLQEVQPVLAAYNNTGEHNLGMQLVTGREASEKRDGHGSGCGTLLMMSSSE